ncbi:MAG: chloride channel protein [Deltaproteobacteria bacterium]|nr:chloride channel protein [Deltaproteobacteria bacterium]PXF52852.1 MAG: chloride channel protein [Deltaproteobacteria bacterium]
MPRRHITNLLDRLVPSGELVLMVMAAVVGAGTGLAAVFFIRLIALIEHFSYTEAMVLCPSLGRLWLIVIPVLGALIGGPIIAYFATEAKGHGVPEVMKALILRGGRIRPRVAIAKIFASALCIGSGGSAGREGPIVQVGSALGSTVGQWLHLSDERIKNLVACGAAAGIAATFNAPIAGVAFSSELLMSEHQVAMLGNVVIASVSSSIISRIFLGANPAFEVPSYVMHSPWEILLYAVLGLLAAFVGIMFIRMLDAFEELFDHWKFPQALKPAVGALLLGILAFSYPYLSGVMHVSAQEFRLGLPLIENLPHVYGSGFPFMKDALQGKATLWLFVVLIFLKPLATSFTLGSGNSGGIFAPSLFTGAVLGGAYGYVAGMLFPNIAVEVGAYALVGMAAVFAAAARAPLTSILIVFEMSGDYHLILPLMTASIIGSSLTQWLHPDSIYTLKLTKRGIRFDQGRDLDVMQGVMVEEVMNQAPITVHKDQSLAELFAIFQETHLYGFPVMENDEDLYGIVTLQDMERALEREGVMIRDLKVRDVATPDPVTVFPDEPIWSAIRKMGPRHLARLPVVSRHAEKKLLGLISRSDILRAYDVGLLKKQQAQYARERMTLRKVSGIEFIEVLVKPGCPCAGKKLAEINLPQSATVISIERGGNVLIPGGSTEILPEDRLTIFCQTDLVQEVRMKFSNDIL